MILNNLTNILQKQSNPKTIFARTLLKEGLQDYVLKFIYNNKSYKELIFTGGTCLKKIYSLPRLSEDLDFDSQKLISIIQLTRDLKIFFQQDLQYPYIETKISNNNQTIFLKFPVLLSELGLVQNKSEATMLFLRCDLAQIQSQNITTEINSISTPDFSFFVKSYDLPTLFANKIGAFLQRDFFKGESQQISFKGRDVFDLVWFFEKVKKNNFSPNWYRLYEILQTQNKNQILEMISEKIKVVNPSEVILDLEPFTESIDIRNTFAQNFKTVIQNSLPLL